MKTFNINKISHWIQKIKVIYLLFLVCSITLSTIVFVTPYELIISDLLLYTGAFIVLADLLTKRASLEAPGSSLLVLFSGSFFISVVLNFSNVGLKSFHALGWTVLLFFLLYTDDKVKKTYCKIIDMTIIITFLISIVSLIMLFMNFSSDYVPSYINDNLRIFLNRGHDRELLTYTIGIKNNLLTGITTGTPTLTAIAAASFMLSIIKWLCFGHQNRKYKYLCIVNMVFQFITMVFAGSRSGTVQIVVSVMPVIFLCVLYYTSEKRHIKKLYSYCISVTAAISFMLIFFTLFSIIMSFGKMAFHDIGRDLTNQNFVLLNEIQKINNYEPEEDLESIPEAESMPISSEDFAAIPTERNELTKYIKARIHLDPYLIPYQNPLFRTFDYYSSRRIGIWYNALRDMKPSPLFGVVEQGTTVRINIFKPWTEKTITVHNDFINVLKSAGILGFILYLIFHIFCVVRAFKKLWSYRNKSKDHTYFEIIGMLSFVSALFLKGLLSIQLSLGVSMEGALYWIFLGALMHLCKPDKETIFEASYWLDPVFKKLLPSNIKIPADNDTRKAENL